MVLILLGLAVQTIVVPRTLNLDTFSYLVAASSPRWVGIMFVLVSYARCLALVVNGRSYVYGPHVRALGALAGALIWAQMDLALIRSALLHPENLPQSGIPVYLALTLSELFTVYRAMTDVRRKRP